MTTHVGCIQLVHFPFSKQPSKHFQAFWIPGQQQQTGRIAIKPMDEPQLRPNSLYAGNQGIALGVAKTGLAQQPGRLLHHQKTLMPAMNLKPCKGRSFKRFRRLRHRSFKGDHHGDGPDGTNRAGRAR